MAEFLAAILALRKLHPSMTTAVIVTDSLALCASLTTPGESHILRTLRTLVPNHLQKLGLVRVPGHKGLVINELADTLAKASIAGPVVSLVPNRAFVTAVRFIQYALLMSTPCLVSSPDLRHLQYPWSRSFCQTRKI